MRIWMAKFGKRLATWLCIGIGMTNGSKEYLRDILSLVKLDNRGIATSFYSKRQGSDIWIELGLNF